MLMYNLNGKVALVTGSSRGLGKATALALAKAGADIVITDILLESALPSQEEVKKVGGMAELAVRENLVFAEKTGEEIRSLGRRCFIARMDVTEKEEIQLVAERVKKELGDSVDILVNNAGMVDHRATIENQSDELWQRDLQVNLTGPFNCIRAFWEGMKAKKWGRIINISSVSGLLGGFGQASYATTKMGIVGLTKSVALEGARFGITCNAVAPGTMATEAFLLKHKLGINPEINNRIIARTAMKKVGDPEDTAHAVCFLASEHAKYITGEVLPVCGGVDLFVF